MRSEQAQPAKSGGVGEEPGPRARPQRREVEGRYPPLSDYAVIGDTRTMALISRHGSLDWLCLPRVDSPSLFGAILDRDLGGRWRVAPRETPDSTAWRYLPGTNVLETVHTTASGRVRVLDAAIAGLPRDERVLPDHEIVRHVECLEGEVEVELRCEPRPDYGRGTVRLRGRPLGWWVDAAGQSVFLRAECDMELADLGRALVGRRRLRAGERMATSLTYCLTAPAIVPVLGEDARHRIDATADAWRRWSGRMQYDGPWREWVQRSALALKLLCFAPSGAVLAAGTCSLPEQLAGERNWDYRFCWLRDASLTISALLGLGYVAEAEAFGSWLLTATRLSQPELRVLYDVYGSTSVDERILQHLEGYRGSRPVRIGNAAVGQLQLDVYGTVLDSALRVVKSDQRELDRKARRMLLGFGEVARRLWREPDAGIWEVRSGPRHHTLGKAMCWVALDRLLQLHEMGALRVPEDEYRAECERIREAVLEHGWNDELGSYTHSFHDDRLDASLLLLAIYGFEEAGSERMRRTTDRIYERLSVGSHLHRYRHDEVADGVRGGENTFGICGFWGAHVLAMQGRIDEAEHRFEELLAAANGLGLLSEEFDPHNHVQMGNLPQAYTHVGLINAARAIERARGERSEEA